MMDRKETREVLEDLEFDLQTIKFQLKKNRIEKGMVENLLNNAVNTIGKVKGSI
ncbi:hypothetical protein GOQ27_15135 [Clostridium sp. D2Q-11]|uniref:Uncharacterized protein n=1 Tax=Anaeromonas frigoriresistens TaxID=2683708 RepID=A0A942V4N5_9FIRM|nr:hypothetical protein [Anaeromonas frigoriresistens]MBS4539807.1 hypothetical protein [Anaeromonas frigoriresistens]